MRIIAHRGNVSGTKEGHENSPEYILEAIRLGFDAEVDVWYRNNKWYLGHDSPDYEVENSFFTNEMWLHCKNLSAVQELKETNLNWFWHEDDKITQTSKGYIWCYPGVYVDNAVAVVLGLPCELPKNLTGVCTDHAAAWRSR